MKLKNRYTASVLITLISTLMLLNACAKPTSEAKNSVNSAQLINKTLVAETINQGGILDGAKVTIIFTETENIAGKSKGRVSGKSACNNYEGQYELSGNLLKIIPPLAGTKMMCEPAMMTFENDYISTLSTSEKVSFSTTGAMIIYGSEGKNIVFRLAN
jgi:heat shock protein HslJ